MNIDMAQLNLILATGISAARVIMKAIENVKAEAGGKPARSSLTSGTFWFVAINQAQAVLLALSQIGHTAAK